MPDRRISEVMFPKEVDAMEVETTRESNGAMQIVGMLLLILVVGGLWFLVRRGMLNATSRSSGFFCIEPQLVKSFDVQTELTYDQFLSKYPESHTLGRLLVQPEPIPFEPYKNIPGITPEKLLALHAKHLEARK